MVAAVPILWVAESGPDRSVEGGMRLAFRFSDTSGDSADLQILPSECRALKVGFRNHQMNRAFALRLLEGKPDAVYICGLYGGTLDLIRVACLLGVRVCLELLEPLRWGDLDARTASACDAALQCVDVLVKGERLVDWPGEGRARRVTNGEEAIGCLSGGVSSGGDAKGHLDYALYEFCLRDHPLLLDMQRPYVAHFRDCKNVLDLACGAGIFLELLGDQGVAARGVERDPKIAEYARGMGLDVETSDALTYLGRNAGAFDGIYCSHFVEHLPFEAVQALMGLLVEALSDDGVLVLVFPDPESIRSQLLGFWRDPEHVRFYHPELIELMAMSHGLICEWSSQRAQPHRVVPFPSEAPELVDTRLPGRFNEKAVASPPQEGRYERFLWKLGLVPRRRLLQADRALEDVRQDLAVLKEAVGIQGRAIGALGERTETLWQVNQTWAWDDNAVLRFRKPARKR